MYTRGTADLNLTWGQVTYAFVTNCLEHTFEWKILTSQKKVDGFSAQTVFKPNIKRNDAFKKT